MENIDKADKLSIADADINVDANIDGDRVDKIQIVDADKTSCKRC